MNRLLAFILICLVSVPTFADDGKDTFFETSEIIYDKNTGIFTSVGYSDI